MIYCINKLKNKKYLTISIDVEKVFDKIKHPFIIKKKTTLQKEAIKRTYLNIIKNICDKPTVNITLN